jgi:apolipoprotein D and lipocalin family protein
MKKLISKLTILFMIALFSSCSTIPKGVTAITPFDKEKYLGKWYEIARFDFKFERGLNNTTAEYSLNNNGTIKVVNRGFNYEKKIWKEAVGKAKFAGDEKVAKLKVSFFGPFYAGYNVIAIDPDYKYALVSGSSFDYLWILSREKTIPSDIKTSYLEKAERLGFKVSNLLWIEHDK